MDSQFPDPQICKHISELPALSFVCCYRNRHRQIALLYNSAVVPMSCWSLLYGRLPLQIFRQQTLQLWWVHQVWTPGRGTDWSQSDLWQRGTHRRCVVQRYMQLGTWNLAGTTWALHRELSVHRHSAIWTECGRHWQTQHCWSESQGSIDHQSLSATQTPATQHQFIINELPITLNNSS